MALQLNFTTDQGFQCSAAYALIKNFDGNKDRISLGIWIYKDHQSRIDEKARVAQFRVDIEIAHGATMEQMYTALKSYEGFETAIDC